MIRALGPLSLAIILFAALLVGCDQEPDEAEPSPSAAGQAEASPSAAAQEEPSPSPANQRLAFVSNRDGAYRLYTMDADGGDIRKVSDQLAASFSPFSISQDSTQVAVVGGDESGSQSPCVYRVDVMGGKTELLGEIPAEAEGPLAMAPRWETDDLALLISGYDACYEVPSGGGEVREKSGVGCLKAVVLAEGPQGRLAAVGRTGLEVFERLGSTPRVLDGTAVSPGQGEEGLGWDALFLTAMQRMGALRPVWSPDGKLIAYFRYDVDLHQSSVAVISADGGEPRVLVPPGTASGDLIFPAAWSPDSKRVIFASLDEEASAIQDVAVDDGTVRSLAGGDGYAYYFPQWVTEAPAPQRLEAQQGTLWTDCSPNDQSEADLSMSLLKGVTAARDAGLAVYWLGASFEAGGVVFRAAEAKFPEGIEGLPLQGLALSYSSQPEPAGFIDLELLSRSDWDQVKEKVINPPLPGVLGGRSALEAGRGSYSFCLLTPSR